ncbi:hypothetical protein P43SY_005826 [Pythium insidiosum]|uniref:PX domain-containing protein n=1 Tax=Pythium insidiosum TaxID=114742 RepID=A0AAD5QB30_PYTIN|nr:hypothetical protein P43SY_005826 [Pythium insidiosum]KAJ0412590.1 hypothetical protein ATCC90586_006957 [Pythium insidiosum]
MNMPMLNISALITGYETVGDHTEFIVQISCNGGLWLMSRRFSDFDQLHARLVRHFGDLIEARLPEKQWFGRFDPNFLHKRQVGLQEYLDSLLQVPGILEDRSLQHFLELEKHLDLHGDLLFGGGSGGHGSGLGVAGGRLSNGMLPGSKSGILNENDRLNAIVENATQTFIDVSEVPEPLEAEQAAQRKNEIVQASQSLLSDQQVLDSFSAALKVVALPAATSHVTRDVVLARLEDGPVDGLSYDQATELLQQTLRQADEALRLDIAPPSTDLLVLMDGTPVLLGNGASQPVSGGMLADGAASNDSDTALSSSVG